MAGTPVEEGLLQTLVNYEERRASLAKAYTHLEIPKSIFEAEYSQLGDQIKKVEGLLHSKARSDQSLGKKLRERQYSEGRVQVLLSALLEGSIGELEPAFDPEHNPRYTKVESLLSEGYEEVLGLLEALADIGILHRKYFETLVECPSCEKGGYIFVHYKCRSCRSPLINVVKIYQHAKCGYTGVLDVGECPRCGPSQPAGFKRVGVSVRCEECGKSSGDAEAFYYCRSCGNEFSFFDAKTKRVYSYTLGSHVSEEAKSFVGTPLFRRLFEEQGFGVEAPGYLQGTSGVTHSFTLVARGNDKIIALDLVEQEAPISTEQLFTFYAKVSDTKPHSSILIALPGLNEAARFFAYTKQIFVVESTSFKEAATRLRESIRKP